MKTVTINFAEPDIERFDCALSDFLCWVAGFKAAGGSYSPATEGSIRDLRIVLRRTLDSLEKQ